MAGSPPTVTVGVTEDGSAVVRSCPAAASGVVVRALVEELGLPLNREAAVALYAALVCDTGRFQYETTTPAVFELARELVEFEVPIARLSAGLTSQQRIVRGRENCLGKR